MICLLARVGYSKVSHSQCVRVNMWFKLFFYVYYHFWSFHSILYYLNVFIVSFITWILLPEYFLELTFYLTGVTIFSILSSTPEILPCLVLCLWGLPLNFLFEFLNFSFSVFQFFICLGFLLFLFCFRLLNSFLQIIPLFLFSYILLMNLLISSLRSLIIFRVAISRSLSYGRTTFHFMLYCSR